MPDPLPSLASLRAFEAAARHLSMTRAAAELHRTHGAVSRQIRQLEEELGFLLFVRGGRTMALTAEGAAFAERIAALFDDLRAAVAEARRLAGRRPVVVGCGSTVAVRWLVPRLLGFYQSHPEIELQLSLASRVSELTSDRHDVAIHWASRSDRAGVAEEVLLMQDRLGPVCAPDLLAAARDPAALLSGTLIRSDTVPDAWDSWATLAGHRPEPAHVQSFEHFFLALQAAVSGLGVAIASAALVVDDIVAGRLVAPFGFVPTRSGYRAALARPTGAFAAADRFVAWLRQEALSFERDLIATLAAGQRSA